MQAGAPPHTYSNAYSGGILISAMAAPSSSSALDTVGSDRRLLELIGDAAGLLEIDEFRHGLLDALRRAVPADWVAINDIGPDPETFAVIIDPPVATELFEKFKQLSHENPLIERYTRTRDGRAMRFSDLVSAEQLHALDVYTEVYKPMGIEHQIAFTLPHEPERILAVVLARSDADFSDAERELLEQARPFLIQAYRNAIRYSELLAAKTRRGTAEAAPDLESLVALGLTHRQAQVLQLLAIDISERDIATHLQISQRTVQKHLQRAYRTLSVNDRRHATSVVWATIDTPTQTQTKRIYRAGKPGRR